MGSTDKGSVAVEFGLIFPVLVLLFAGVAELGRAIWQQHVLTKGVREAVRYLSRVPNLAANPTAQTNAQNLVLHGTIDGSGPMLINVSPSVGVIVRFPVAPPTSGTTFTGPNTLVRIEASFAFEPLTGFDFANGITINVAHEQRYLGE